MCKYAGFFLNEISPNISKCRYFMDNIFFATDKLEISDFSSIQLCQCQHKTSITCQVTYKK